MSTLIKAGNFIFPTPTTFDSNLATIVDSARNVNGFTTGSVIRDEVAKATMSWAYITGEEWASILRQFSPRFGGAFYRDITFFSQIDNWLVTRTMYVSDRSASSFLLYNEENAPSPEWVGLPSAWTDASLSLVEV